jgi:hypothetical protein
MEVLRFGASSSIDHNPNGGQVSIAVCNWSSPIRCCSGTQVKDSLADVQFMGIMEHENLVKLVG